MVDKSQNGGQAPNIMAARPKICIVTPSFQQGGYIEETIRSIVSQNYPNLEYIVIDGGSRDQTVEIIKKYEGSINYWVSEKDRGQSHAINKGLARCTADIFNWINSDDMLAPGSLFAVADEWMRQPGRVVAGGTELFDETGVIETIKARGQTLTNFVRFWEAKDFSWAQQGTFVPSAALKAIGGVREDLTYCMDYHMMVRLLMSGVEVAYVDQVLSRFRSHPLSKTTGTGKGFRLEKIEALRSIRDLPVGVTDAEWNAEAARRLVDMARHAWRGGALGTAVGFMAKAMVSSPGAAGAEIRRRYRNWQR